MPDLATRPTASSARATIIDTALARVQTALDGDLSAANIERVAYDIAGSLTKKDAQVIAAEHLRRLYAMRERERVREVEREAMYARARAYAHERAQQDQALLNQPPPEPPEPDTADWFNRDLADARRKEWAEEWLNWAREHHGDEWATAELTRRNAREEENRALADARKQKWNSVMDSYKAELRAEWTAELLAEQFAMPDGTKVAWGEASIEQHQVRVALFLSQAHTGMEGAARHQKAIDELTARGVAKLNDLT